MRRAGSSTCSMCSLARGDVCGGTPDSCVALPPSIMGERRRTPILNPPRPGGRSVGTTRGVGRSIGKRVCLTIDLPTPRCHGSGPWLHGRFALHHRMEPDPKNPCPKNCDVFVNPSCLRVFVPSWLRRMRWCDASRSSRLRGSNLRCAMAQKCGGSVSPCLCGEMRSLHTQNANTRKQNAKARNPSAWPRMVGRSLMAISDVLNMTMPP